MNFKKFVAVFRNAPFMRIEYEIIGDHLYLMTPYMACVLSNTKTLPKVLDGVATQAPETGATKKRIMSLMENVEFDFAINTQMTYQRPGDVDPCVILQGTDKTGKPYPVLVNQNYFSLTPENPSSVMTSSSTGIIRITGNNDIFLIMPVRCSQKTISNILGTVQTFCMGISLDDSELPTAYVRLDDVARMLSELGVKGPPCGFNSEDAWDRAIFEANQNLQELPIKMHIAKEK